MQLLDFVAYQHTYQQQVNSAFYPSTVGKSSIGLHGWGTASDPIWQAAIWDHIVSPDTGKCAIGR